MKEKKKLKRKKLKETGQLQGEDVDDDDGSHSGRGGMTGVSLTSKFNKISEEEKKLILKGMFYEDVNTWNISELLQKMLQKKTEHKFKSFYHDFYFVKSY